MKYVLENANEAIRLERQSQSRLYDPAIELAGFQIKNGNTILDAGCGSGAIARLLAERHPKSNVVGLDVSPTRIKDAKKLGVGLNNLRFIEGSLFEPIPSKFDRIVCRYVLEHVAINAQQNLVTNLVAALKPRGQLRLIDIDGYMQNIYPRTSLINECLKQFLEIEQVDLFVGRKLHNYLVNAGLKSVSWTIQTLAMNEPAILSEETALIRERFENSLATMAAALGSETKARNFQREYLDLLGKPGTCLFYNRFLVTGERAGPHQVSIVSA